MSDDARTTLIGRIETVRERWRRLADDVGEQRMEQPGAMGDWTFKDVASHLTAWRQRTVARLEAAARGEPEPPPPWAAELGHRDIEDDEVNDWIHERTKDRRLPDVLAEADATYDAFIAAVRALPAEDLADPTRFPWLEGQAVADADFGSHLDEHEPDVRRWLNNS